METMSVGFEEVDRWDQALRYLQPHELLDLWVRYFAENTVLKITGQKNGVALAMDVADRTDERDLEFERVELFSSNTRNLFPASVDFLNNLAYRLKLPFAFPKARETMREQHARLGSVLLSDGTSVPYHLSGYEGQVQCCEARKTALFQRYLRDNPERVFQMDSFSQVQSRGDNFASVLKIDRSTKTLKISPYFNLTAEAFDGIEYRVKEAGLWHPLYQQGYESFGCEDCTIPGKGRAGRFPKQREIDPEPYEENGNTCGMNSGAEIAPDLVLGSSEPTIKPDFVIEAPEAIIPVEVYEKLQQFMKEVLIIATPRMAGEGI